MNNFADMYQFTSHSLLYQFYDEPFDMEILSFLQETCVKFDIQVTVEAHGPCVLENWEVCVFVK